MQHDSAQAGRRRLALAGLAAWAWPPLVGAAPRAGTPRPAIPLAADCPPSTDPRGYLVSEKLDGVRGLWDGHVLRFRSGTLIQAPAWFIAALPARPLDGELWMGRGRFEAVAAAVRREQPLDEEWRQVRYGVFELPGAPGDFQARSRAIEALAGGLLVAVAQQPVADAAALRQRLAEVVAAGGEGLVLHRADAPYLTGRSSALLKLKPLADADGVVIGHLPGRGRHEGRLGALRLRLEDGSTLEVGTGLTDAQRASPPPLGSTVTFTYRGRTRYGVPRFASFLRVRADA